MVGRRNLGGGSVDYTEVKKQKEQREAPVRAALAAIAESHPEAIKWMQVRANRVHHPQPNDTEAMRAFNEGRRSAFIQLLKLSGVIPQDEF